MRAAPTSCCGSERANAADSECGKHAGEKKLRWLRFAEAALWAQSGARLVRRGICEGFWQRRAYTPCSGRAASAATAKGMPPEWKAKAFTRLGRAAELADSPGAGVGLSLAREIIAACGGCMKARDNRLSAAFSMYLSKV
jgi:hypothetical protein